MVLRVLLPILLAVSLVDINGEVCPPDSLMSTAYGTCYHLLLKNFTHEEVQLLCEKNGYKMFIGNDKQEIQLLFEFLEIIGRENGHAKQIWVGARYVDGEYRTLDDFNFVFDNWNGGEKKYQTDHDCLAVSTNSGKWFADKCDAQKSGVCVSRAQETSCSLKMRGQLMPPPDTPRCSINEIYIDPVGACIRFVGNMSNFFEAIEKCKAHGSELAIIDPRIHGPVINHVGKAIAPQVVTKYWLGATGIYGQWMWINGSHVSHFNWGDGDFRTSFVDRCLASKANGEWLALNCYTEKLPFICRRAIKSQCADEF